VSHVGGEDCDASDFYDLLVDSQWPDVAVETFAAAEDIDLNNLQEGDIIHVTSATRADAPEILRQTAEITRHGNDIRVQFVGNVAITADIEPDHERPMGFTLAGPKNGINAELVLGNDYPGMKVGYFIGGEAQFDDGTVYPNWTFGPLESATMLLAED
jgi:hypothetical protein